MFADKACAPFCFIFDIDQLSLEPGIRGFVDREHRSKIRTARHFEERRRSGVELFCLLGKKLGLGRLVCCIQGGRAL